MIDTRDLQLYQRWITAMLNRAGNDDPEGFAQVVALLDEAVTTGLRQAAATLRTPHGNVPGYSWANLARPLGVSRSAAQQRFGTRQPQEREKPVQCATCRRMTWEPAGVCAHHMAATA